MRQVDAVIDEAVMGTLKTVRQRAKRPKNSAPARVSPSYVGDDAPPQPFVDTARERELMKWHYDR